MKTDIKRLHHVHNNYPNNKKGAGKTTYCLDSLLRAAQTGYYKNLCYVTNTERATETAFKEFLIFLDEQEELYILNENYRHIWLYGTRIDFSTKTKRNIGFDGYILDYFAEENKLWYDIPDNPIRITRKLPYFI